MVNLANICRLILICAAGLLGTSVVLADPVNTAPRYTFAGNIDFAVTGGSLRSSSNGVNACSVNSSDTATLSGIPGGARIRQAFLYWAGSGSSPDLDVTFQGSGIPAARSFTENYTAGGIDIDFFSGFADVTGQVTGNGSYTFSGLTVTNTNQGGGANYCSLQAVVAGWGLIVVYDHDPQPLRVINLFDGFQYFRGSEIQLNPGNFVVPASPIDGKIAILSWEGDVENSGTMNGYTENLVFDGESVASAALTDTLNPANNQFNSTVNATLSTSDYGVDLDVYDLSPYLRAGDSSATTYYRSGADFVLLSAEIISVTNTPVADLAIAMSHSGDFSTGVVNDFVVDVDNLGPSAEVNTIVVTDTLPGGVTYAGYNSTDGNWVCSAVLQDVTCQHPGPLASGSSLAAVNIEVDVDPGAGSIISNTATVTSATFDPFSVNNSASDNADVLVPDLSTSTKTVSDLNGAPLDPGDTVRYRVTITESAGAPVDGVTVTDTLDTLLTNLNVTDDGGGTDNSTAGVVQIDDLDLAASSSVIIEFEAEIAGSALAGEVVSNSADITNPGDPGAPVTVDAPDLTVSGGSIPATGNKNVYMGDIGGTQNNPVLPMILSRNPLTAASSPTRVRIRRQDNNRDWQLTPVLQDALTLDGSTMTVFLQMRRNGNTNNRDIRVSLSYVQGGSTTLIGCVDRTLSAFGAGGLSNSITRQFQFDVPRTDANCNATGAAPFTIPTGATLELTVDNEPNTGFFGRAVFVYPYNTTNSTPSYAVLPATTVINVDSIGFYDAAYPGGSLQTAFPPGATVYVRSVVSDPFGTFDISAVSYRVLDPSSIPVVTGSMTQVQDSGANTATYEISYAVPGTGPVGFWSAEVTGVEGTEGTVTHTHTGSFEVSSPSIEIEKEVEVISDPVTISVYPKAIPLAVVEYTIRATNTGLTALDVDSVFVEDTLPGEMRVYFGTPVDPFTFTDNSSGLSFSFAGLSDTGDDVRFSNDGGSTFITPAVDGDGFDATVPRVNFIEFNPKGAFAASGSGNPSFEITFRMRID